MATKTRPVSTKTYDPHPAVPEQKAQQGGRIKLLSHGEEREREGRGEGGEKGLGIHRRIILCTTLLTILDQTFVTSGWCCITMVHRECQGPQLINKLIKNLNKMQIRRNA